MQCFFCLPLTHRANAHPPLRVGKNGVPFSPKFSPNQRPIFSPSPPPHIIPQCGALHSPLSPFSRGWMIFFNTVAFLAGGRPFLLAFPSLQAKKDSSSSKELISSKWGGKMTLPSLSLPPAGGGRLACPFPFFLVVVFFVRTGETPKATACSFFLSLFR